MGFCHRVWSRLYKETNAANARRCLVLPFLQLQVKERNRLKTSRYVKERKIQDHFVQIGCSALIIIICILHYFPIWLLPDPTASFAFVWSIDIGLLTGVTSLVELVTAFLAFVRILISELGTSPLDRSTMDVSILNCGGVSVIDNTVASKVLAATKRNFARVEKVYLELKGFTVLINQLVFFCLCEKAFLLHQPVVSFYTLMFFNVITYCVSYIKELIEREDWSLHVRIVRGNGVRHLAMSTTKIVLEWTRAVTFLITVVFILLVLGLEKGLKNYSPGIPYLVVTGIYYILSEKVFVELISKTLDWLKLECFESMENLYSPVILKGIQIVLSFIFTIICGLLGYGRLTAIACFTNLRVKYKEVDNEHWQPLICELIQLMKYRCADKEELLKHDDVCAICLQPMKTARVTPCRHLFHADCLRMCLKQSPNHSCPICKQNLPPMGMPDRFVNLNRNS